jgi:hypothetical protein
MVSEICQWRPCDFINAKWHHFIKKVPRCRPGWDTNKPTWKTSQKIFSDLLCTDKGGTSRTGQKCGWYDWNVKSRKQAFPLLIRNNTRFSVSADTQEMIRWYTLIWLDTAQRYFSCVGLGNRSLFIYLKVATFWLVISLLADVVLCRKGTCMIGESLSKVSG